MQAGARSVSQPPTPTMNVTLSVIITTAPEPEYLASQFDQLGRNMTARLAKKPAIRGNRARGTKAIVGSSTGIVLPE